MPAKILIFDAEAVARMRLVIADQVVSIMGPDPLNRFEVREAGDGQEGIDVWEEWAPHLICMDIRMPVLDGFEATRPAQALPRGAGDSTSCPVLNPGHPRVGAPGPG